MNLKDKNTRSFAKKILYNILYRSIFFSDAFFIHKKEFEEFSDNDKKYIYQLVFTVLRRSGQINKIINLYTKKPIKNPEVNLILKLGVAQILFLRTPNYASVNQTVELVKNNLKPFRPLVNAVLRKISDNINNFDEILNDPNNTLPTWLLKKWRAYFGKDITTSIAESILSEPYIDITKKISKEKIFSDLNTITLPNDTIRIIKAQKISDLPSYHEGRWWVQDAAASIPATLLINKMKKIKDKSIVLDVCAAPGGKTAQLINAGLDVISVDKNKSRVNLMKENLKRLDFNTSVICSNFLNWKPDYTNVKGILLDAPCSGTGTLRKNPDIIWNRDKSEISKLSNLQIKLIKHSLKILRPGGYLVYSVCSIEPEEGINIAKKVALWANVKLSFIKSYEMPELQESITTDGFAQVLPFYWKNLGGLDGFFIARFEKK